jgi:hypothetical protein
MTSTIERRPSPTVMPYNSTLPLHGKHRLELTQLLLNQA